MDKIEIDLNKIKSNKVFWVVFFIGLTFIFSWMVVPREYRRWKYNLQQEAIQKIVAPQQELVLKQGALLQQKAIGDSIINQLQTQGFLRIILNNPDGTNQHLNMEDTSSRRIITRETLIPLSLLGVFVGGVFWIVNIGAQTNVNSSTVDEIKTEVQGMRTNTINLNERITRIETKIDYIIESIK